MKSERKQNMNEILMMEFGNNTFIYTDRERKLNQRGVEETY